MITVTVNTSKKYDVLIGENLLEKSGEFIKSVVKSKRLAVITDDNVAPLYFEKIATSFVNAGFEVFYLVLPNGEASKNYLNYIKILNFLAENRFSRTDAVVALGGGVVGDISGFAAATYLRGISFIQIPTTLLAAVDSSVGGKTAINLEQGKNLAGAFYQPDIVICDILTLNTLPDDVFKDGCGEIIKYGVLGNPALFNHLHSKQLSFDREYVISECVSMKRDIVCRDEFDNGVRQLLNLGHTVGHSLEKLSDYKISHGSAVATGLAVITKAAVAKGFCSDDAFTEIRTLLADFGFDIETEYSAEAICSVILSDKKIRGDLITLVLPEKMGKCGLHKFQVSELNEFILAGVNK